MEKGEYRDGGQLYIIGVFWVIFFVIIIFLPNSILVFYFVNIYVLMLRNPKSPITKRHSHVDFLAFKRLSEQSSDQCFHFLSTKKLPELSIALIVRLSHQALSFNLSMASSSRPRSSSSVRSWDYEVFLSFRGPDTRGNFTSHLHQDLIRKGIMTFIDDGISKGEDVASDLFKAIENSRSAVVILSRYYAVSHWCLEELAKIIECHEEMELLVFPVFYHVEPSHVRKQMGSYGEAFANHERNGISEQTQIRWRFALKAVGNIAGWHVDRG